MPMVVKALKLVKSPGIVPATVAPKKSSLLEIFDIPIDMLDASENNPNEQTEATFDQLVEGIKEDGFDEPVIVIPNIEKPGRYIIVSGHHRVKGARVLKMHAVPCVIKKGWDQDKRDIELVRRNMLKGSMNPEKFTDLYNSLVKKGYDASVLKLQMGFTQKDAFAKVYKQIQKSLPAAQRAKLAEAKETITSIDGLSSVLNNIFKDHGTDIDHGMIAFSFGGKDHVYVECTSDLMKALKGFQAQIKDRGQLASDVFSAMIKKFDLSSVPASNKIAERRALRESKK